MWPFKKQKPLSEIPSFEEQKWSVSEGAEGDAPLIIRYNSTAQEWKGHKSLGIKLGFSVPLNKPDLSRLPQPKENEQLLEIEDIICENVLSVTPGFFALAVTDGTMKEFVFYIPEGIDIANLHKGIEEKIEGYKVQCMAIREPNWSSFTACTNPT